jgi:CRISPR-associated protein Cmr1
LKDLKEKESAIFGSPDEQFGRSKVILLPPSITKKSETKISGTPHHRVNNCTISGCDPRFCGKGKQQNAMCYDFTLTVKYDNTVINQTEIKNLFKTTFLLGGLGKRERRGFGSVMLTQIDGVDIFKTKIEIDTYIKTLTAIKGVSNFAWFKQVEIGKKYATAIAVLEAIGLDSHTNSHNSLGYAKGQQRLASPIYVSVIKDENNNYYPIITTLNTSDKGVTTIATPLTPQQTNFINALNNE